MSKYKTEQEEFWAGNFGDLYINRNNKKNKWISSNIYLFSKIFKNINKCKSIIEFGSNIGLNLYAVKSLLPEIELNAIEINKKACLELENIVKKENILNESIIEVNNLNKYDIVLIKGVLIHINPDELNIVYEKLYNASNKYIIVCEYFNPSPVTINYRGYKDRLFKRDFAGELLDKYDDLELIDYGFIYSRDKLFPQDDTTWFLLKKK